MKKLLAVLIAVLALTACAVSTPTPVPQAAAPSASSQPAASGPAAKTFTPDIASFEALPSTIEAGDKSVLKWEVNNATSISIDQGVGPVPTKGTWLVSPSETTTYKISATNKYGTATMTAQVIVRGTISQATVESFHLPVVAVLEVKPANIVQGSTAILSWEVKNSFDVAISPGFNIIPVKGSREISPAFTTTYKLTTNNENGTIIATTTLTVSGAALAEAPVIRSFVANPYVIRKGGTCILSWESVEGSSASIDNGIGIVDGSGTYEVKPAVTTIYNLTVTNPRGAQFQSVAVNVR